MGTTCLGKLDDSIENFTDKPCGGIWKRLATSQYNLSIKNGKVHEQAMQDTRHKIFEVANNKIEGGDANI